MKIDKKLNKKIYKKNKIINKTNKQTVTTKKQAQISKSHEQSYEQQQSIQYAHDFHSQHDQQIIQKEYNEQKIVQENDNAVEQDDNQQKYQQQDLMDVLQQNQKNLENYQAQLGNKGVVYMSRVPPYMTPNYVRKLLKQYGVQRIYLLPESQWVNKNRVKKGGSKRICFRQGWIEFEDKRMAKVAAMSLNGQKMVPKKHNFYSEDLWNLKYLPKFKWHHLTQKLAHQQRLKKQKLKVQLDQEKKIQEYYSNQLNKSKQITGIIKKKQKKGQQVFNNNKKGYMQTKTVQEDNQQ